MLDELRQLQQDTLHALQNVNDFEQLETLQIRVLGRKGKLAQLLARVPDLPNEQRAGVGTLSNQVKSKLLEAFAARTAVIKNHHSGGDDFDPTWPGIKPVVGHKHPVAALIEESVRFFGQLGYSVAEGPEVETVKYNFDLLNIPATHPSRDLWDTFYLETKDHGGNVLLRTHTSPVQIRYMESHKPPVYIIAPGRAYRHEATDPGHETTFTQIEGLAIDKNIRVTDLIGTLDAYLQHMFGKVKMRVRPHYYPFVEPGMDVDMSCLLCNGKGCPVCKQSGWLEMLGAGMVHPTVLKNMHVDPKEYSGFAFGMGAERLVMLLHGVTDIRLFLSGDLRFLEQFTY
jgi:phenylalanyl-tRNA synthetase alpha chain